MTEKRWSDEELERIRRSVAMLVPGHLGALDRELALRLLDELQGARRHRWRLIQALDRIRALAAADHDAS